MLFEFLLFNLYILILNPKVASDEIVFWKKEEETGWQY